MPASRPITPAELELSDIRLDAQTAAGMTTADTTETALDRSRARNVVSWVLWTCWGTGVGVAAWFVWVLS